jgi:hypothetical protein
MEKDYYSLDQIKTKFKSYKKFSESNITNDEYLRFCDEIKLLPKKIVDKIQIEIQFTLLSADPDIACYINLKKGFDKKKKGIIVLTPLIFMAPYVDKDGNLKQIDRFKMPHPILHEIAHHELGHSKTKNKKDYDKNENAAWELADKWFKQWDKTQENQRPKGHGFPVARRTLVSGYAPHSG